MMDPTQGESGAMLRCLFEHLPDLVVVLDREANILFANRNLANLNPESLVQSRALDFAVPWQKDECRRALAQAFDEGRTCSIEAEDIFGQSWSVALVPLADDGGGVARTMAICSDVTQQRKAIEATAKEQRLLRRLLDLHEADRRLVAYEIHDGFAQQLAGALFRLQGFRETLASEGNEAWRGFDAAVQMIQRAIDETRRLIGNLRPPILDERGIVDAIEYLVCEHRAADGPAIEFEHDLRDSRLAPPLEIAMFRIVQESLENACRHSHSDRVCVRLGENDGWIHAEIRDWGVGFSVDHVTEQRFGLQGIRERVRLLGGRATIESAPGEGTRITVELPRVDAGRETAGTTRHPRQ